MEIGAKGYKDTFVHFQITGNQQAEEKAQYLQYLEILVLNKKLKLSLKKKTKRCPISRLSWLDKEPRMNFLTPHLAVSWKFLQCFLKVQHIKLSLHLEMLAKV